MNSQNKKIPPINRDLILHLRRRRTIRLLLLIGWITVFMVSLVMYNQSHETSVLPKITGWRLLVWIFAVVIGGVLLLRIPQLFFCKTFEGVILRSTLSRTYSSSDDYNQSSSNGVRTNTSLRIRTNNGKIKRIRFEEKNGFYLYYHEGNYLCRLSGFTFPVVDPCRSATVETAGQPADEDTTSATVRDPMNSFLCVVCGHLNAEHSVCDQCGHSLIDPKVLFQDDRPQD